eukprot:PhF_6_TR43551/c0_g1_i2/m.66875
MLFDLLDPTVAEVVFGPIDAEEREINRLLNLSKSQLSRTLSCHGTGNRNPAAKNYRGPVREKQVVMSCREARSMLEPCDETVLRRKQSRTVCVTNLAITATRDDILSLFLTCGMVRDVTILLDKSTHRSKGTAYVEFTDPLSVDKALQFNGCEYREQVVRVQRPAQDLAETQLNKRKKLESQDAYIVISNIQKETLELVCALLNDVQVAVTHTYGDPPKSSEQRIVIVARAINVIVANETVLKYDNMEIDNDCFLSVERVYDWTAMNSTAFVVRNYYYTSPEETAEALEISLIEYLEEHGSVEHFVIYPASEKEGAVDIFIQMSGVSQAMICIRKLRDRYDHMCVAVQRIPMEVFCARFNLKW